eukprot:COSAG02_NODE_52905_length_305_cov_0.733010_1_plen_51_part_01
MHTAQGLSCSLSFPHLPKRKIAFVLSCSTCREAWYFRWIGTRLWYRIDLCR